MKYWTISFPGEYGQHVVETWSQEQILKSYYTYWNKKMFESGNADLVSEENCIQDWIVIHHAYETNQWGKDL